MHDFVSKPESRIVGGESRSKKGVVGCPAFEA